MKFFYKPSRLFVCLLMLFCFPMACAQAQARKTRHAPAKAAPAPPSSELAADPAFHSVFRNQRVAVWRLELAPGAETQLDHRPHDYLILALTAATLEMTSGGAPGHLLQMQPEQMEIMKGGWAHKTVNHGDSPLIVVEIEPLAPLDPEHAVCGLTAHSCKSGEIGDVLGEYTESMLFETGSAILTKTEVAPNAAIPSHERKHDTLLVAAVALHLRDRPGDTETAANDRDLQLPAGEVAWFTAGTRHLLKNLGPQDAHFLLLEIK